jgi:hypothetical protein
VCWRMRQLHTVLPFLPRWEIRAEVASSNTMMSLQARRHPQGAAPGPRNLAIDESRPACWGRGQERTRRRRCLQRRTRYSSVWVGALAWIFAMCRRTAACPGLQPVLTLARPELISDQEYVVESGREGRIENPQQFLSVVLLTGLNRRAVVVKKCWQRRAVAAVLERVRFFFSQVFDLAPPRVVASCLWACRESAGSCLAKSRFSR